MHIDICISVLWLFACPNLKLNLDLCNSWWFLFWKSFFFLKSSQIYLFDAVEPSPGVDPEGLEVAKECLSDVFKISYSIDSPSSDSLVELFRLRESNEQRENKSNLTHNQFSTDVPSTSAALNKVDANHAAALQYLIFSLVKCFILPFSFLAMFVKWSNIYTVYRRLTRLLVHMHIYVLWFNMVYIISSYMSVSFSPLK